MDDASHVGLRLAFEDYFEIQQVLARYGHMMDTEPDQFATVFTQDCVWDLTSMGGPVTHGMGETLEMLTGTRTPRSLSAIDPSPKPVFSHHTTNVEIVAVRGDTVETRCKYVRVSAEGVIAGSYYDTLVRTPHGWRISARSVVSHG